VTVRHENGGVDHPGAVSPRHYLPGKPDADDIAWALVKAARAYGQINKLAAVESVMHLGELERWRWFAVAAVRQAWRPNATRNALAFADRWTWTSRGVAIRRLEREKLWWNQALVDEIAGDLGDAHGGA
jgi:hypothetical protein